MPMPGGERPLPNSLSLRQFSRRGKDDRRYRHENRRHEKADRYQPSERDIDFHIVLERTDFQARPCSVSAGVGGNFVSHGHLQATNVQAPARFHARTAMKMSDCRMAMCPRQPDASYGHSIAGFENGSEFQPRPMYGIHDAGCPPLELHT